MSFEPTVEPSREQVAFVRRDGFLALDALVPADEVARPRRYSWNETRQTARAERAAAANRAKGSR